MTLDELNALDRSTFAQRLGGVAEGSPWVAEAAWLRRPFADLDALARAFADAIHEAPPERQLALVRAHPDLAGRVAVARQLTTDSAREQAGAGLDRLTPEQLAVFRERNAAYRERFGFPFVICVRGHDADSILRCFGERLAHDREQELRSALDEIVRIVALRLGDVVGSP